MLIVLYLIFTSAYVNSKAVDKTYREQFEFIDNIVRLNDSASQTTIKNGTIATTPNYKMLLDDLNRRKNLKLIFFDKMLSDEMLSIKKHIQEKGSTLIAHLNISSNIPASTPTLEIKQKWPTIKNFYLSKNEDEKKSTKYYNITNPTTKVNFVSTKINYNDIANETQNDKEQRRNKVVGVRSFTDRENLHANIQHDPRKCMCVNEKTTCTARCIDSTKCDTCRTRSHVPLCTRKTTPYSFYPYVITYMTPYVVIPTAEPLRNHKHKRKHKRPHTHSPKYDYEDTYDNKIYDEEINHDTGNKYEVDNNHYEGEINEGKDQFEKGSLEANKEKLVSNIVDDLKVYYNDAVIKDCYCSSWSNIFQTKCFTFYIIIYIMFFI